MPYQPILGTLGYILSPDKEKVLLIHRNARKKDEHLGKYNGLGGKLEPDEDIVSGMKREIKEEANLDCTSLELRGTINWTGFGKNGEDWMGFIFLIHAFSGTPPRFNQEGELQWVSLAKMHELPMWEGDKFFLPLVFDQNPKVFHGLMPYQNGQPSSWNFQRI